MTPEDRKYTKTHEWIKLEHGAALIGITDYAQKALGDITFVELPETDQFVEQGSECGVIESVKAASDIYAPVSGELVEVNEDLNDRPELINEDPYEKGWMFRMENIDSRQFKELMDASDYEAGLEEEA